MLRPVEQRRIRFRLTRPSFTGDIAWSAGNGAPPPTPLLFDSFFFCYTVASKLTVQPTNNNRKKSPKINLVIDCWRKPLDLSSIQWHWVVVRFQIWILPETSRLHSCKRELSSYTLPALRPAKRKFNPLDSRWLANHRTTVNWSYVLVVKKLKIVSTKPCHFTF
jgi:hypothetical protein